MSDLKDSWQRTKPKNFLREERQLKHPIRQLILGNVSGGKIGDFGCASCIDYPMWRDGGYDYTGIDITDKFLEYAKELYPMVKTMKSDITCVPLDDGFFDTCYCKDVLEHQPPDDYLKVIDEMWRLASETMIIAFYIAPTDKPTRYELVKNLHYKNHYNKDEIMNKLNSLNPEKITVTEKIGYNNSALYVVKKK